jgi:hypothetical protein
VSPSRLGHLSASIISPHGDRSCSLETGHSRGERCDSLHWVENSQGQRPEYISTIDPRRHTVVDLATVRRIDTLESEGVEFETPEARRAEEFIVIDLWEDTHQQIMNSG